MSGARSEAIVQINHRSSTLVRKDEASTEQRLVYGVVLEPETPDTQGDIYSAAEIEASCHRFMADYQNVGEMHKALVNDGVDIVECFIAPVDFEMGGQQVKRGTWIMGLHVKSDRLWSDVKSGAFTGLSIGGFAERIPIEEAPT